VMTGGKSWFAFVFKLPMIAADGVTCWLLWRIGRERSARLGAALSAGFALLPISILITAHHCNTEPLYVMLSLAAVYLLQLGRPLSAGLALGLAINVKLVPIFLVAPLLASCAVRRDFLRLLAGLAIMAIPSLVVLCITPAAYLNNVVRYKSDVAHWGIGHFMLEMSGEPSLEMSAERMMAFWFEYGRYFILASSLALAGVQWRTRRYDRYTLAAIAMTLFLVIAPGFGLQYLLAPAALLLVAWPAGGGVYGVLAGLFALAWYLLHWDGTFPIRTIFVPIHPLPGRTFGLLTWGWLVVCLVRMLSSRGPTAQDATSGH